MIERKEEQRSKILDMAGRGTCTRALINIHNHQSSCIHKTWLSKIITINNKPLMEKRLILSLLWFRMCVSMMHAFRIPIFSDLQCFMCLRGIHMAVSSLIFCMRHFFLCIRYIICCSQPFKTQTSYCETYP